MEAAELRGLQPLVRDADLGRFPAIAKLHGDAAIEGLERLDTRHRRGGLPTEREHQPPRRGGPQKAAPHVAPASPEPRPLPPYPGVTAPAHAPLRGEPGG